MAARSRKSQPNFSRHYWSQFWNATKGVARKLKPARGGIPSDGAQADADDNTRLPSLEIPQLQALSQAEVQAESSEPSMNRSSSIYSSTSSSISALEPLPAFEPLTVALPEQESLEELIARFEDAQSSRSNDSDSQSRRSSYVEDETRRAHIRRVFPGVRDSMIGDAVISIWHQQESQRLERLSRRSMILQSESEADDSDADESRSAPRLAASSDDPWYQLPAISNGSPSYTGPNDSSCQLRRCSSSTGAASSISIGPAAYDEPTIGLESRVPTPKPPHEDCQEVINRYATFCERALKIIRTQNLQLDQILTLYWRAIGKNKSRSLTGGSHRAGSVYDCGNHSRDLLSHCGRPPIPGGGPLTSHPTFHGLAEMPITPPQSSHQHAMADPASTGPEHDSGYYTGRKTYRTEFSSLSLEESPLAAKNKSKITVDNRPFSASPRM